jgi:hypothetical protein
VGPVDNQDVVPGCYHKFAIVARALMSMVQYQLLLFAYVSRENPLFPRDGDLKSKFRARDVKIDASVS